MHRKWLIALAAAVLVFAGSVLGVGAEQAKGSIKGTVTNLTAGGGSVVGAEVSLLVFDGQNQTVKETVKVDQEGKFAFEGLETGQDLTYLVLLQFQNVDYPGEPLTFTPDNPELTVEIPCLDSTTAADGVTSPARHYLLDPDPEGVSVTEIVILRNTTDKSYVGAKEIENGIRETMRFVVPEEAEDLAFGDEMSATRIVPVEGGFADTMPIYPGDTQRILRYRIPAKGGSVSFSTRVTMASEKVSILAPDIGIQISASNLPEQTNPTVQNEKYLLLSGQNLAADTELKIKVDRLPSTQVSAISLLPLAGGVGVVLIGVVVLVLMIRRRRGGPKTDAKTTGRAAGPRGDATGKLVAASTDGQVGAEDVTPTENEYEMLEKKKRELISAIARLDDQYEAKEIGDEEYSQLRADKKRKLVEVVEMQKMLSPEGFR